MLQSRRVKPCRLTAAVAHVATMPKDPTAKKSSMHVALLCIRLASHHKMTSQQGAPAEAPDQTRRCGYSVRRGLNSIQL